MVAFVGRLSPLKNVGQSPPQIRVNR